MNIVLAYGGNNTSGSIDVATAVNACASASGRMYFESETFVAHSLRGEGFDASEDGTGRGTPLIAVADTLTSNWHKSNGAIAGNRAGVINPIFHGPAVRRLMPIECERLQGFPDRYTAIPFNGKQAKDGPRYKALGNSMAVPVMSWIGARIHLIENELALTQPQGQTT